MEIDFNEFLCMVGQSRQVTKLSINYAESDTRPPF